MFGGNGATFYQRQQVSLNAFTRNIRTGRLAALTDFVDFVDKHDPVLLNSVDSVLLQLFRVHQFRRFFFNQQLHGVFDFQLTRFLLLTAGFWNMDCSWLVISSMPGGAIISTPIGAAARSISISLSSSWPSRSFCGMPDEQRTVPAAVRSVPSCFSRWDQHVENTFFCQFFSAITVFSIARTRTIFTAASVRSRIIESTSLPT